MNKTNLKILILRTFGCKIIIAVEKASSMALSY